MIAYKIYNFIIRILSYFTRDKKAFRQSYSHAIHKQRNAKAYKSRLKNSQSLTFLYGIDTVNAGDLLSCPDRYFTFDTHTCHKDIVAEFNRGKITYPRVIIGGGKLDLIADNAWKKRLASEKAIFWGGGVGLDSTVPADLFQLMGIREHLHKDIDNKKVFYVPCASCMSRLFDLQYSVQTDVVFYAHGNLRNRKMLEYAAKNQYPIMTNYEPSAIKIMRFLGSAKTIVTNSYHGLYWGTLLGKKLIVLIPSIGKMHSFRYEPVFSSLDELPDALQRTVAYPQALKECRDLNKDFYARVCQVLECGHISPR